MRTITKYRINLTFNAELQVEAGDREGAIELAIEKARLDYGNEVADYGNFTIEGEENEQAN
jgi:hypothetical protein